MKLSRRYRALFLYAAVLFVCLNIGASVGAEDKENCLLCHKYRFIGRIDETGKRINYNVSEYLYSKSVHRNVPCRDCHIYITKLPHDPVKENVNCANQCHVKPPFSDEKFSHKKIIDIYNQSSHGIKAEDTPELKEAKPYCKFCHLNPLFLKVEEKRIAFDETLLRCKNCHEEKGVAQAYMHITHRLRHKTSRSPQEIVTLCSKCHLDVELMKKLKVSQATIDAVATYKRSVHGQSVMLGSQVAPDCISCHSTNLLHDIYKRDDKRSTVNKDNLEKTCRQCHVRVNQNFIQIAVHPSADHRETPVLHALSVLLTCALYGTISSFLALSSIEAYRRRKDGIKWKLKQGTSWRGVKKSRGNIKS